MLKAFSMTLLGATCVALFALPAQALEVGPVQVILQPRVVVGTEAPPRRVVVVREPEYRPVVERRVVVVHKHRRHGHHRDHYCEDGRWTHHDDDRYERTRREVVIVRR